MTSTAGYLYIYKPPGKCVPTQHQCLLILPPTTLSLNHSPGVLFASPSRLTLLTAVYSQTTGQYHSVKGTVVETIGDLTGSTDWQQSGRKEHTSGEAEYNEARAKDYVDGATDRLTGKKEAVLGAVTGDRQREISGKWFSALRSGHCLIHSGRQRPARQGMCPAASKRISYRLICNIPPVVYIPIE
jgi:uncharacterized protein YjbJ (UPF0337 family)